MQGSNHAQPYARRGLWVFSALLILAAVAALAAFPHNGASLLKMQTERQTEEPFSSAMRGESNGESGQDALPPISNATVEDI